VLKAYPSNSLMLELQNLRWEVKHDEYCGGGFNGVLQLSQP